MISLACLSDTLDVRPQASGGPCPSNDRRAVPAFRMIDYPIFLLLLLSHGYYVRTVSGLTFTHGHHNVRGVSPTGLPWRSKLSGGEQQRGCQVRPSSVACPNDTDPLIFFFSFFFLLLVVGLLGLRFTFDRSRHTPRSSPCSMLNRIQDHFRRVD
jgi:hypothetical protein